MDTIDLKILSILQQDGRITNKDLAEKCELAPSSMLERVRRLEERGAIRGYRADVDPRVLGYDVQAVVMINLDRHQAGPIDQFEQRIGVLPEVRECRHLTGRYDYVLQVVARDLDHLGTLVKHTIGGVAGIEKVETFLVLSAVKEDSGYAIGHLNGKE